MYTAERNLGSYLAEHLTDTQTAISPDEVVRQCRQQIEKRGERRFPVNEKAALHWCHPLRSQEIVVQILDVSRSGLGISLDRLLKPGTEIQMYLKEMLLLGEVRYCVRAGEGFQAGILLDSLLRRCRGDRRPGGVGGS